jgi:hypothetical protein
MLLLHLILISFCFRSPFQQSPSASPSKKPVTSAPTASPTSSPVCQEPAAGCGRGTWVERDCLCSCDRDWCLDDRTGSCDIDCAPTSVSSMLADALSTLLCNVVYLCIISPRIFSFFPNRVHPHRRRAIHLFHPHRLQWLHRLHLLCAKDVSQIVAVRMAHGMIEAANASAKNTLELMLMESVLATTLLQRCVLHFQ